MTQVKVTLVFTQDHFIGPSTEKAKITQIKTVFQFTGKQEILSKLYGAVINSMACCYNQEADILLLYLLLHHRVSDLKPHSSVSKAYLDA